MKLWVDDIRPAPSGYILCRSVKDAIALLKTGSVTDLDLDHDLGSYAIHGGDAINILDWCVQNEYFPRVRLHTMNPVGRQNMQRILDRYWS